MDILLLILAGLTIFITWLSARPASVSAHDPPEVPFTSFLGAIANLNGFLKQLRQERGDVLCVRIPFWRKIYFLFGDNGCKFFHGTKECDFLLGYAAIIGRLQPSGRYEIPEEKNMVALTKRFTSKQYDDFAAIIREEVERFADSLGDSGTVDLFDVIQRYTLRFGARIFTGLRGDEADAWIRGFRKTDPEVASRDFLVMLQQLLPGFKERRQAVFAEHQKTLDVEIDRRLRGATNEGEQRQHSDVFDDILRWATDPATGEVNRDHVYMLAWSAMIAGTLTSFATLSWLIVRFVQRPDVRERALQEFEEVAAKSGGKLGMSELGSMSFYESCIRETIRLGVAGISFRETTDELQYVNNGRTYRFPKGSLLLFPYKLYSDSMYDRPDEFLPERHSDDAARQCAFIGFGAGRHPCPGARFASQFLKITSSTLFKRFDFALETEVVVENRQIMGLGKPTNAVKVRYSKKGK